MHFIFKHLTYGNIILLIFYSLTKKIVFTTFIQIKFPMRQVRIVFYCIAIFFVSCSSDKTTEESTETIRDSSFKNNSDTLLLNPQLPKQDSISTKDKNKTEAPQSSYAVEVIKGNAGFGFDILKNGKAVIHQPHIPAVPGLKEFKTKEEAKKTGELMLKKIEANVFPPTVSIGELDSLGIGY
jgi:hypothetical protein